MSAEGNTGDLIDRAMAAFRWVVGLRLLGQIISWLSTIFVIRFLAPEDYGVIALSEVFRTFLLLFSNVGFSQALMKVSVLTEAVIRRTLGLLVVINFALFLIQFCLAPLAAQFYNNPDLELVLRLLAFTYLFVPWSAVPSTLVARNLQHQKTSKITFSAEIFAALLSLAMAYAGFGYWALVAPIVFTSAFNFFFFNLLIDYPRRPSFSIVGMDEVLKFGSFVALSEVLFVAYNRVDVVMAGKLFDVAQVGLYGVAVQLSVMLMAKSVPLFNVVAFPTFARLDSASRESREYLLTTLRFASVVVFPVFFGVAMVGEELISLILGDKWTTISGLFVILVVTVPLRILAYVISPALLAAGGARMNMVNSLLTLIVLIFAILLLYPHGLVGIALAWSVASCAIFALTCLRGGALLGLSISELFRALAPACMVAALMCTGLYSVDLLFPVESPVWRLYKIPLGAALYLGLVWLLFPARAKEVYYVLNRLIGVAS